MSSADIKVMLDEALQLCQAGAFTQAEQIYHRVIDLDAETADAWNMLAVVLYQQERLDEAAQAAERATQLRPHIPPYWLTRGNIALARRRTREGQSNFGRAIELNPAFAEAHYRLALSYHYEHRIKDAIAAYRAALRHAPDVAEIHYQFAEALTLEDRWAEATHAYQEAFARDPEGMLDRRRCIDCFRYFRYESLPEFWVNEITRFFARDDIDKTRYVGIGAQVLLAKNAFRSVLEAVRRPDARLEPDAAGLREAVRDALFQLLLQHALVANAELEFFLTRLRAALLFDERLRTETPPDFLCALALQCFNNEFIFAEGQGESSRVTGLQQGLEAALQRGDALPEPELRSLLVVAMYRPLHAVRGIELLLARTQTPPALDLLLQRTVKNVLEERGLREEIRAIGATTDEVSHAVREMYEENPYPRWFSFDRWPPLAFADWLEREVPALATPSEFPAAPSILVAGCGTGQDAIWLASDIAGARVLAVDLSRSSLAYAQRMARELGVTNIEFRHGDILGLGALAERYDLIYSKGLPHHLRNPQTGLRVLAQLLRPGGLLKIGLYSERARASVNSARQLIRERALKPTAAAIREFRQQVFAEEQGSALKPLCGFLDFYSLSMCRDLIFHVQEHQFRLPQIEAMLRDAGLTVLGLSDIPRYFMTAYRWMFPADGAMKDLSNWDAFEVQHPDTFISMYQIWCRNPEPVAS